jgi:hypothetical protein
LASEQSRAAKIYFRFRAEQTIQNMLPEQREPKKIVLEQSRANRKKMVLEQSKRFQKNLPTPG